MYYKNFEIEQITRKGNFYYKAIWMKPSAKEFIAKTVEEIESLIDQFHAERDIEFPIGEFFYK